MIKKVFEWVVKVFGNPWMPATAVSLFACLISFFQVNSYGADKNNLNGFWVVVGCVLAIVTLFCAYKTAKTSTGSGG